MDITANNIALLVSLRTMLDEKNVTKAARLLGVSQPALSAQLSRLRHLFGDQLLTPAVSGKGMVPTSRGAELREPLRLALQHLEDAVRKPSEFDPQKSDRIFTVAANDNASAIVGTRLIQLLRTNGFYGLRLSFRGIDPGRLPVQLETGEIDVALVSNAGLPVGMPNQSLLDENFMMAQRVGHPRGSRRPSIKEYAKLDHVIVSAEGGGFRGFVDDTLREKGFMRRVGVSVQYYSVVPLILQSTDMVCTLPARFLSRYRDTLISFPLPFEARRFSLYATWHARFDQDPEHVWLRKQIALCAAD